MSDLPHPVHGSSPAPATAGARAAPFPETPPGRRASKRTSGAAWVLASATLHLGVFAAFAASFGVGGGASGGVAVIECAAPEADRTLDDAPAEPAPPFPEIAPPEDDPPPMADDPLPTQTSDEPEFRDPRESLANALPTIGLGAGNGGFRRSAARWRAATASPTPAPTIAERPAATPLAPAPVRAPGPSRAARFAAPPSAPAYPEAARRLGWEGVVRLRIDLAADGTIASVLVIESSGRTLLDDAAVDAAKAWRFEPALSGGEAVPGSIEVPVRFRLQG